MAERSPYSPPRASCAPESRARTGLRPVEGLILVGVVAWLTLLLRPILLAAIHGG